MPFVLSLSDGGSSPFTFRPRFPSPWSDTPHMLICVSVALGVIYHALPPVIALGSELVNCGQFGRVCDRVRLLKCAFSACMFRPSDPRLWSPQEQKAKLDAIVAAFPTFNEKIHCETCFLI